MQEGLQLGPEEAAALRANLRRRKQQRPPEHAVREPGPAGEMPSEPRAGHA